MRSKSGNTGPKPIGWLERRRQPIKFNAVPIQTFTAVHDRRTHIVLSEDGQPVIPDEVCLNVGHAGQENVVAIVSSDGRQAARAFCRVCRRKRVHGWVEA
jgi:hypothetical protein